MPCELYEDTGFQDGNPSVGYYEHRYEPKGSDEHSPDYGSLTPEAVQKRREGLRAKGTFMGMVDKMREDMKARHKDITSTSKGDLRARSL